MLLIMLIVFATVFAVFLLVSTAMSGSVDSETARINLEAVLRKVSRPSKEEVVNLRKQHVLSTIPWLDRLLARVRPAAQLKQILEQADLQWTPGRLVLVSMAIWLVTSYAIGVKMDAPAISIVVGLVLGMAPFLYVLRKRQKRFRLFLQKLTDSIDLMVSALRAGNSTMGALGIVATDAPEPVRREFRTCFDEQTYGVDMRSAMDNLVARVPLPDLRIITTAILIQKESGGNLAEVLDKTSQVIRERFRLMEQIRVHTAQGRLTGAILSFLPVIMAILLSIISPAYTKLLITSPLGHKMLAGGIALNLIGWVIIRKIINIEV